MCQRPSLKARQYKIEKFWADQGIPITYSTGEQSQGFAQRPRKVRELGRNTPSFTGTNSSYWCIFVSCEMQMSPEGPWALGVNSRYPVEEGTCSSICCSGVKNNSQDSHVITVISSIFLQNKPNPPPGSDLQCKGSNLTCACRAGWDTDRAPAGSSTVHGGVKLLLEGTLNTPAALTWQIQHQAQGQWHNGTLIYILTCCSQARRAVEAGRGKSCSRMTWRC